MKKPNSNTLKLKPLHYEAMQVSSTAPDLDELRARDLSQVFEIELIKRIERGNLINIHVKGEQTSGKSLVGFAIQRYVNVHLLKGESKISLIAQDQIEFLDKIKDTTIGNTCMLIDEWNELSTTGYNASTNQAMLTYFNEVQAQRFIHKITCSPEKIIDPTARIILEVYDKDIKNKTTRCLIYYVLWQQGIKIDQLLGYVDIDVSEAINDKTWLAYRKRKFERMNMLLDHKIIDNRKADESKIVLDVVNKLKTMAMKTGIVQKDIIRNYVSIVQERFNPISIYGEDKLVGTIFGILILLKNAASLNSRINKLAKASKKLEADNDLNHVAEQVIELKKVKEELLSRFEESMQEHDNIIEVIRQFSELDEDHIADGELEMRTALDTKTDLKSTGRVQDAGNRKKGSKVKHKNKELIGGLGK